MLTQFAQFLPAKRFQELSADFYTACPTTPMPRAHLVAWNTAFATELGLAPEEQQHNLADYLVGNQTPQDNTPLPTVYSKGPNCESDAPERYQRILFNLLSQRQDDAYLPQVGSLITTAGEAMRVDSGLPDFRGDHGFWASYAALGKVKMSFTDIACPQNFVDSPRLTWGFYGHSLNLYRETQPHLGFDILQQWAQHLEHGCFVYTSNVDGQFQKSGFDWVCCINQIATNRPQPQTGLSHSYRHWRTQLSEAI